MRECSPSSGVPAAADEFVGRLRLGLGAGEGCRIEGTALGGLLLLGFFFPLAPEVDPGVPPVKVRRRGNPVRGVCGGSVLLWW